MKKTIHRRHFVTTKFRGGFNTYKQKTVWEIALETVLLVEYDMELGEEDGLQIYHIENFKGLDIVKIEVIYDCWIGNGLCRDLFDTPIDWSIAKWEITNGYPASPLGPLTEFSSRTPIIKDIIFDVNFTKPNDWFSSDLLGLADPFFTNILVRYIPR